MTELLHHGHQATDAMLADFKKLVAWVHTHADICCHMPNVESVSGRQNDQNYTVCWQCESGHAYRWPFNYVTESNCEKKASENGNGKRKRTHIQHACGDVQFSAKINNEFVDSDDSVSSLLTHISGEQGCGPKSRMNKPSPEVSTLNSNVPTREKGKEWRRVRSAYPCMRAEEGPPGFNPDITSTSVSMDGQGRNRKGYSTSELEYSEGNKSASAEDQDPLFFGCVEGMNSDDNTSEDGLWNVSKSGSTEAFHSPHTHYRTPPKDAEPASEVDVPCLAAQLPSTVEKHTLQERDETDLTAKENVHKRQLKKTARKPTNIANFQSWILLHQPEVASSLSGLSAQQLDVILASYLQQQWLCGVQGPSSRSVLGCSHAIDRYLRSTGCGFSLAQSVELREARTVLHACVRHARRREQTHHLDVLLSLQHEEEEEMRRAGALGRHSPRALLSLVLLNNLRAFGKPHLQGPTPPCFGHFRLVHEPWHGPGDALRLYYLEWRGHDGGRPLRMHASPDEPARCPLQDFRLYASKHCGGFPSEDDAFYSTPRAQPRALGWYTKAPGNIDKVVRDLSRLLQSIRACRQSGSSAT